MFLRDPREALRVILERSEESRIRRRKVFASSGTFACVSGVLRDRSVVEGASVCAEKDPGFFAALRMTKDDTGQRGKSLIARVRAPDKDPHLDPLPCRARGKTTRAGYTRLSLAGRGQDRRRWCRS